VSERRPRLLVLASTYPGDDQDGTPAFVRTLAEREAARFDTLVLAPMVPGAARAAQHGSVRVRRFRYFPARFEDLADGAILENLRARRSRLLQVPALLLAEAAAVRRAVRDHDPDVIHVHWIVPQGLVALAAARGRPWLVTTHGGDLYALRGRAWLAVKRAVLRQASAATGVNHDMVRRMVALGAPPERTRVLPMGVDLARVRALSATEVGRPGHLVFVGRLVEKKGLDVLLTALRVVSERDPELDWSLSVIGDGPLRDELAAQAAGLPKPVRFHGQCPAAEVARLLGTGAIYALPSRPARSGDQDGLPVALLEAMAVGLPVVASRIPGVAEAVRDGQDGLLVEPGDADALADALTTLLTDEAARRRLAAGARARSETYSVETIGARYVELLAEIARAEPGRPSRG
jgi:glycosyltransferase involved in cell wall biosynthesis